MTRHTRLAAAVAGAMAGVAGVAMPGCIAKGVREGTEESNAALAEVNRNLERVTEEMMNTNVMLNYRLYQIEVTNEHLAALRERLATLDSIDGSLTALDLHLASLRRTLDNIDSTIPFFNMVDPAGEPAAAQAPAEPGAQGGTEPPAGETTAPAPPRGQPPEPVAPPSGAPPAPPPPGGTPPGGTP